MQYKKIIICLDGHSSKIERLHDISQNIASACRALSIPFEFYENPRRGWRKFQAYLNQPDVLYILNDSVAFHLCEKPHILISRASPWVMSDPKPTTIGRLTQEQIALNPTELIALISKNKPIRQNFNLLAATTHFITSEGRQNLVYNMARYGKAAASWEVLSKKDMHIQFHFYEYDGLPFVNRMLVEAIPIATHQDDIIVIMNRDICLIPEATGILRSFMDSRNIDACFASRVDCFFDHPLSFWDLHTEAFCPGIDFFAFRPNARCLPDIIETDLFLGRLGWDSYWANIIGTRLPYNICYHYPHPSDWTKPESQEQNIFNAQQIARSKHPVPVLHSGNGAYYAQPL